MAEVLISTRRLIFPKLLECLENATFIAIDAELSGLYDTDNTNDSRPSLFSNGQERYTMVKDATDKFHMWQLGISTFARNPKENTYTANIFNLYLMPANIGTLGPSFVIQAEAISFLCQWKFDFNKVFYDGLPFLNRAEEKQLSNQLSSSSHLFRLQEVEGFSSYSALLAQVQEHAEKLGSHSLMLEIQDSSMNLDILRYEVHRKFSNILTTVNDRTLSVLTFDLDDSEKRHLRTREDQRIKENILEQYNGATAIVNKLFQVAKKGTPIVGHNPIFDLLYLYKQFCDKLPDSLDVFKELMAREIPMIYDTKQVANSLRVTFKEDTKIAAALDSSVLGELYKNLETDCGRALVCYSPRVQLGETATKYEKLDLPHEAGYDAYMTGVCFLRMAHLYACKEIWHGDAKQLTAKEHMSALRKFSNLVHLGRCITPYINLGGKDPESVRPAWLYVKAKGSRKIHTSEILEYARRFGSSDVRLLDSSHALLAFASVRSAEDLLQSARKLKLPWAVVVYNPFIHSRLAKNVMWAAGGASFLALVSAGTVYLNR